MATSSALPVAWTAPADMLLSIVPTEAPRPICSAFVPPTPAPEAELVFRVCCRASLNVTRPPLKPTVLTLARSFAATSSMVCCDLRPEMAEYMPRIIGTSPSLGSFRLPQGGPAGFSSVDGFGGELAARRTRGGDRLADHPITAESMLVNTWSRMDC